MTSSKSKILTLFCSLILLSCNNKSIVVNDLTQKDIPDKISFRGKLIQAKKWTDNNGENILVISLFGPFNTVDTLNPDFDFSNVELNMYQFLQNKETIDTLWKTSELISKCHTDMYIEVFPNSVSITDLNKNGITETTLIYRYFCKGDISPSKMKVVLHEGKKAYCLQGKMYSDFAVGKIDKTTFTFNLQDVTEEEKKKFANRYSIPEGRYINDLDFKTAPPEFLTFAKNKWIEYCDKDSVKHFLP